MSRLFIGKNGKNSGGLTVVRGQKDRWGHPINQDGYPAVHLKYENNHPDNPRIYDKRIPRCNCGHRREDHIPYEGNWTCHATGGKCLPNKKGGKDYCFHYVSSDKNLGYARQLQGTDVVAGKSDVCVSKKQKPKSHVAPLGSAQSKSSEIVKRDSSSKPVKNTSRKPSVSRQGRRSNNQSTRREQGDTPSMKTLTKSGIPQISMCPRCNKRKYTFQSRKVSIRDNLTYICDSCERNEKMLDKTPLSEIPTRTLLMEESFQRRIMVNYFTWIHLKREKERKKGVK